jgi:hypothetical protein
MEWKADFEGKETAMRMMMLMKKINISIVGMLTCMADIYLGSEVILREKSSLSAIHPVNSLTERVLRS